MGITVLSLCDGMSCCQIALNNLGIEIDKYYSAEIKDIAIKVTQDNYPNTIQIGDINKISYKEGILYTETGSFELDPKKTLLAFGSPCQSFSIAMKTEMRVGLEDKKRSGLFLECYRIFKELNPKWFFMENVASMKNEDRDFISKLMGVNSILIDAKDFGPCLRKRLYWTNIPTSAKPPISAIKLSDILDDGWSNREKARCLLVSDSRPLTTPIKMFHRYFKFNTLIFKSEEQYKKCLETYHSFGKKVKASDLNDYKDKDKIFEGIRYLNQNELEKCHGLPQGYTQCLTRNEAANVIGDGWSIPVIKYLFTELTKEEI